MTVWMDVFSHAWAYKKSKKSNVVLNLRRDIRACGGGRVVLFCFTMT